MTAAQIARRIVDQVLADRDLTHQKSRIAALEHAVLRWARHDDSCPVARCDCGPTLHVDACPYGLCTCGLSAVITRKGVAA